MSAVRPPQDRQDLAQEMKSIKKMRLRRQVFENPELSRELVKTEATATYNANGNLVQAVTGDLGNG
ncbi:hypothetical protein F8A88_01570 [Pseudodesulfovibrio senegalensis]|uniref:Uncharacterized protein n=2 Tax=Pseudodesulfovibrio senegalensis TaxID=1721087 RepID=A0A6N6N8C6_9BACT|nr:hypothetical protein F8A88_01570 [Pseudodesulfovibrio senegalensis]